MALWPDSLVHLLFLATASLAVQQSTSQSLPASEQRAKNFLEQVISPRDIDSNSCNPTGLIEDACCDYASIETLNRAVFPSLHQLSQRDFFRYWKVDLLRECPFWHDDDALCGNRACAVEELADPDAHQLHWELQPQLSEVTPVQGEELQQAQQQTDSCYFRESDFCRVEDLPPNQSNTSVIVDLVQNPERFTGYAGPSANRVWKAIYQENCFAYPAPSHASSFSVGGGMGSWVLPARGKEDGGSGFAPLDQAASDRSLPALIQDISAPLDPASEESCLEKRVYYRLISGLHASISIHLCNDYLDPETGEWKPNLECFITRIAEHPERLTNVYFDYVVFARALLKAGPFLQELDIRSPDSNSDEETKKLMRDVIHQVENAEPTFDESQMFVGPRQQLKEEFKQHFRNVSRIMDCVGCDKCRLWGGLQVSGLGTALKFLFEAPDCESLCHLQITRAEVVAFFNTMHRLSESLAAIERFREMLAQRKVSAASPSSYSPVEQKATHVTPSLDVPKSPVPNPTFDVKTPPTSYREVSLNRHAPERFKKPMAVWDSRPKSGKANVFVRNSNLAEEGGIYEVLKDLSRTLWRLIRQRRPRAKSNKDEL